MKALPVWTKHCPRCGAANPSEAAFCLACSQALDPAAVSDGMEGGAPTLASPSAGVERTASGSAGHTSGRAITLAEGMEVAHRYLVKGRVGQGAMGAVYRAYDRELDRDVALKILRPEQADAAGALDRFKREIQLSSRITHKNVLRVYDLGDHNGAKFLSMEFVDGETLASRLSRDGRLAVPQAVSIFRQICAGLGAAHERDIVHRDLKPQNVMLDRHGRVLVTDFGLATSRGLSSMTQTGAIMGTPYYMSPEQVKGDPVDERSDIYALGVMLYEMLTGSVPFSGGNAYEVMVRRLHQPPPALTGANPAVPPFLRKIAERCLAVDAALRYQTIEEVLADLDAGTFHRTFRGTLRKHRVAVAGSIAAAVVGFTAAAGWWVMGRDTPPPATPLKPTSILIADFRNQTGDPVFDGSLEDAFGLALEGAPFITSFNRATARRIATQLKPGTVALNEDAARLVAVREGIGIVTTGVVERRERLYAITVRALDAATGRSIAEVENESPGKGAVLQSVTLLAASIRRELGDRTPRSEQLSAAETFTAASLEAAQAYAQGQDRQWAGNWDDAIERYQAAIRLDPGLGRAYAGLAVVYSNRGRRDEAEKYFKLAMARIARMSDREKYRTRGAYYLVTRQPDKAIEDLTTLVKQYPADTAGLANLAVAHYLKRDMARAIEYGRRALEIYPNSVPQRNNLGLYAMYAGDFPTAITEQRRALSLNPRFEAAFVGLALSQFANGQRDEAQTTWTELSKLGPGGASAAAIGRADIALFEGKTADARRLLEAGIAADLRAENPVAAGYKLAALAEVHVLDGDKAEALDAIERARSSTTDPNVVFQVGTELAQLGDERRAIALALELESRLEPDPQMYARLIRGEVALVRKRPREALMEFGEAQRLSDSWIGRFGLGRAYLDLNSYTEAHAEFEACLRRRGEATSVLLDEVPTYRRLPPVHYYLGRAYEGLGSPEAAEAYKTFLSLRAGNDALAIDARRRLAAIQATEH